MFSIVWASLSGLAVGVSLWESQTASRELIIRSDEQKLIFALNVSALLTIFNRNTLSDVFPTCSGLVGQVSSWFLLHSHFFSVFVSMIFLINRWQFYKTKERFEKLKSKMPEVDFEDRPGEYVFNKADKFIDGSPKFIDGSPLEYHFPKCGPKDTRSISARINDANSWVRSFQTKALYSIGSFILMHIGDMVVFITLACKGVCIFYYGQDLIKNTIQAFFCLLCLGTQAQFWTRPTYNRGFLCTIFGHGLFNWIRNCMIELRLIEFIVKYLSYGPLIGTIILIIDIVPYLILRLFSSSRFPRLKFYVIQILVWITRSFIKDEWQHAILGIILHLIGMNDTSNESQNGIEDKLSKFMVHDGEFIVSKKGFICCYEAKDPEPKKSLEELEKDLLSILSSEGFPIEGFWSEKHVSPKDRYQTNLEALKNLLKEKIMSRDMNNEDSKIHAKVVLCACLDELDQDGKEQEFKFIRQLIDGIGGYDSCPVAVRRLTDYFFMMAAVLGCRSVMADNSAATSFIGQLPKVRRDADNSYALNGDIESFAINMLYILQLMREREFLKVIYAPISERAQFFRYFHKDLVEKDGVETINFLFAIARLGDYQFLIEGGGAIGRAFRKCIRTIFVFICKYLVEVAEEEILNFGSNEHLVGLTHSAVGEALGLRKIDKSIDSCMVTAMSSQGRDSLFGREISLPIMSAVFEGSFLKACALQVFPELLSVIMDPSDERLTIQQLFNAERAIIISKGDEIPENFSEDFSEAVELHTKSLEGQGVENFHDKMSKLINPHLSYVLLSLGILKQNIPVMRNTRHRWGNGLKT